MFDQTIVNLPSRQAKRQAIQDKIQAAKEAGTLTYTDIMLNHQELVTFAFEVMDGVMLDSNNVPQYGQGDPIDLEPVRLVAIDPKYEIRVHRWHQPRVPGTGQETRNREVVIDRLGNDTIIEDRFDRGRVARRLLWEHGWPIRQYRSRTGEAGDIVEWKWFERVAQSPDAGAEYREIYEALKARLENPRPNDIKTKAPAPRAQEQRP